LHLYLKTYCIIQKHYSMKKIFWLTAICLVFMSRVSAQTYTVNEALSFYSGLDVISVMTQGVIGDWVGVIGKENIQKVILVGYTDATGNAADNQILSERRAASIKRYFMQEGIADSVITATGKGAIQGKSNKTEDGRQGNRYVEITIIAKSPTTPEKKKKLKMMFRRQVTGIED
jgi:outer membrane protein OmpA-like peptidoglycan-associated protein